MQEAINSFITQRTNKISTSLNDDPVYFKCDKEEKEIIKQLYIFLPENYKHLISDLNDITNYKIAIEEEIIYKEGICDGIKIGIGLVKL